MKPQSSLLAEEEGRRKLVEDQNKPEAVLRVLLALRTQAKMLRAESESCCIVSVCVCVRERAGADKSVSSSHDNSGSGKL